VITLRTPAEIAVMREAGRVVADTLTQVSKAAAPGVSLAELDALAREVIAAHGARSSFHGYHPGWAPNPYDGVLCLSVNEIVVHGPPTKRKLVSGDLLSVDCGAELGGYHGDAAITLAVGEVEPEATRLSETTRAALHAGIEAARPGGRMGDIGQAIEQVGRDGGYGILADHGGHGIGTAMHEAPSVSNTGRAGRGLPLREGLVIALEPMFHAGGSDAYLKLADGWSIATADGSLSAHWEHTVAITAEGPQILTLP
jgi:methionyl aminopeptidase